jgi:Domain of unknown function (DUF4159)
MNRWLITLGLIAGSASVGMAQDVPGPFARDPYAKNVPYDGRLTLARIRYTSSGTGGFDRFSGNPGRFDPKWDHDYRRSEAHFAKILDELTTLGPRVDASNILRLDDPELFKYPIAYICEVGYWAPNDKEVEGLRNYLTKGGFLIIDDFAGPHMYNFEAQIAKVLPGVRLVPLTAEHPIFDSFYRIESLDFTHPYFGLPSQFLGIFENNDPSKRLMAIVNYNNDISEYWEFSDTGLFPIDLSNEAYKLGVNYMVYALTR